MTLVLWATAAHTTLADSTWEFAVQVSASVHSEPTQIVLSWPQDSFRVPDSYTIHRKTQSATAWAHLANLSGHTTSFTDLDVSKGIPYEYQITKSSPQYTGYGYIYAGIELPAIDNRGRVLLVVDKTQSSPLAAELARFQQDLVGDGWAVTRLDVNRSDTPAQVKALIKQQHDLAPNETRAVLLFGHVPVPYSGDIVPDGHAPDHQGAWPCDAYYGDMDGMWTDHSVNSTSATDPRHRNVPGDGKFDQSALPSAVELMVGRVDLANMPGRLTWGGPATQPSETELLRNYLNKNHHFRHKAFDLPRRAILGDFFGYRDGEAFAASGWRNFSTFFGASNLVNVPLKGSWVDTLSTTPALVAYGCGAGTYTSIAGLGNTGIYNDLATTELLSKDIKTVFALLFGSWLGDWDSEDNILRAVLALPSYGLASGWSGRPHWYLHHMAMGEPIGAGARLTQNNGAGGFYRNQQNNCAGLIHVALMGDPTLRLHPVAPARNVAASFNGGATTVTWTPSSEAVAGYFVYASEAGGPFVRKTSSPVQGTSYSTTASASSVYMIRGVKLEASASGTYWNLSQGAFSETVSTTTPNPTPEPPVVSQPPITESVDTVVISNGIVWLDDAIPAGAQTGSDGGDTWTWVNASPTPYSGQRAHQSALAGGLHQHFLHSAGSGFTVAKGDTLFTHVYLDPANPPSQIMVQWNNGSWEHRAYWGANLIQYGTDGTAQRCYMGPLPAAGQWVRLSVPAGLVGLEGTTVSGMAFSLYGGRATWDASGKILAGGALPPVAQPPPPTNGNPAAVTNVMAWVDDKLPAGAVPGSDNGDLWRWNNAGPAPFSGNSAHYSPSIAGLHQHFFTDATETLSVKPGDVLAAHVYLDPANPPSQVMLQWNNGSWEHRAYWGGNYINYGTHGTDGRRYMGALPAAGKWVRLEVPASQIGLENTTVKGMAFTLYNGAAAWDLAGILQVSSIVVSNPPANTNPPVVVVTNPPTNIDTNLPSGFGSNSLPGIYPADYATLELPKSGDHGLHILSPSLLELKLINTKEASSNRVSNWDFVDDSGNLTLPSPSDFRVQVDGRTVGVANVGFRRRPLYAPFMSYDLRIDNSIYLQLGELISDGQHVQVLNPSGQLWGSGTVFAAQAAPQRFNPAIHVNQEGYLPIHSKKAMVGYYLGSLGEMPINTTAGFKIVDASTGDEVHKGTLVARPDSGYTYTPTPYQKVYEADFTSLTRPGEYRMVVPGLGSSLPFLINEGIAMSFARAYALGLYHQRCGAKLQMPYSRHNHELCHVAPSSIPLPESSFGFTWSTISDYTKKTNPDNPAQTAPALNAATAQLFPFQKQGAVDTSGGHHDAGDYSKYTANSAHLVHYLMFAVDSLAGVAALDNLGLPESGDGISDVLQEAKWEADYLCKLQDSDGGFYFLVYPRNREYESGVTPDKGDAQVVWPKTTSATAAAVAALAQCASSPAFKRAYPQDAARYLQKAQLGWQFLTAALDRYGKTGAYQKITHYGDTFADQDELAWAACEMFLATRDQGIHNTLKSWFNPSDPATRRWGWWHLSENYGHAIRSYAFAVRSGRVAATDVDSAYATKCESEIIAAGEDALKWSRMNAYGTSFPDATKRVKAAGWYFSTDQAFDLTVAYQLAPKQDYLTAMLANMNYEAGCNPVNVSYVTGLGWKRQRDIVHQWAAVDQQALPPSGIPVGNVTANFGWLWTYGGSLTALCFPSDNAPIAPYPFYDRWGDSWNVSAEFVIMNSARSLGCLAFLAAQTSLRSQPWKSAAGQISVPSGVVPVGGKVAVSLKVPGMDLAAARVVWEARDQEPAFGHTFTFAPKNNGDQWVEAEAQWPDGRRVFAKASFQANSPNVIWIDDNVPAGAVTGSEGGDTWTWSTSIPAPHSGSRTHVSTLAPGTHQHYFYNASATLEIGENDILYAWVYIDPANPPSEIMLQWNDGSSWDHRAYWGANQLGYGVSGTASRRYVAPLPAAGKWVQLQVPAQQVGLGGKKASGMAFTLYGGRAWWDVAGRLSPAAIEGTHMAVKLKRTSDGVLLTWNATAGGQYRVSYKDSLQDATWTYAATTSGGSWLDTQVRQLGQRFYSVIQIH